MKKKSLILLLFYPTVMLANRYESPAHAFVVGALSWAFLALLVIVIRWMIKQYKNISPKTDRPNIRHKTYIMKE